MGHEANTHSLSFDAGLSSGPVLPISFGTRDGATGTDRAEKHKSSQTDRRGLDDRGLDELLIPGRDAVLVRTCFNLNLRLQMLDRLFSDASLASSRSSLVFLPLLGPFRPIFDLSTVAIAKEEGSLKTAVRLPTPLDTGTAADRRTRSSKLTEQPQ
jgi:hypothetical protein